MWKLIQDIWKRKLTAAGNAAGTGANLTVVGQKWLGPGEVLRIVEVDSSGTSHRLALWSTKGVAQMVVLPEQPADAVVRMKGAAC